MFRSVPVRDNFNNDFCPGLVCLFAIVLLSASVFGSGAYDHGTATGKGKLQIDLTLNPFNSLEFGQTYVVLGYGLTNRLDIHGYFANQTSGENNYYVGVFYQFLNHEYLDLATALGTRQYINSPVKHLFFPQLLYNIKFNSKFSLGGSIVTIQDIKEGKLEELGIALDIALFIPLTSLVSLPDFIEEFKLSIGAFKPGIDKPDFGKFLPTYSLNFKINLKKKEK
ncbi:MAG: hypothetical protein V3U16_02260 [Candidatus Neomarinimicrobiota bacterium]